MKDFSELMKKAQPGAMDESETKAKMDVLAEIRKLAMEAMGHDVKGVKKVTVASDDEEGLAEGLDKAKEMVTEEGSADEASAEGDDEDMSPEDLDAMIAHLQAKKGKLGAKV